MVIQRQRRRTSAGFSSSLGGPSIAPLQSTNQISSSSSGSCWDKLVGFVYALSAIVIQKLQILFQRRGQDSTELLRILNDRLIKSQGSERGVTGSLELLRINLQPMFDKEIGRIVDNYKETFFLKAFNNLRNNIGEQAVTEKDVRESSG